MEREIDDVVGKDNNVEIEVIINIERIGGFVIERKIVEIGIEEKIIGVKKCWKEKGRKRKIDENIEKSEGLEIVEIIIKKENVIERKEEGRREVFGLKKEEEERIGENRKEDLGMKKMVDEREEEKVLRKMDSVRVGELE